MSKAIKNIIKNKRLSIINECMPTWSNLGIEMFKINDYQYRFIKGREMIDYYITSTRYCKISGNIWGSCIPEKIIELFN